MNGKRKSMGLTASEIRVGQSVEFKGEVWSVVSPHPETGKFWLHRWIGGTYETAEAKVSELTSRAIVHGQGVRR